MRVVIAGELPLAEDLLELCVEAGHTATLYLVETFAEADLAHQLAEEASLAQAAIECHNESKAAKRRLLEMLDGAQLVFASALACSATESASWMARSNAALA